MVLWLSEKLLVEHDGIIFQLQVSAELADVGHLPEIEKLQSIYNVIIDLYPLYHQ